MKRWMLLMLVLPAAASAGCTTFATERNAVAQGAISEELRYREVLDNLAMIADNPGTLPAYASMCTGTAQITDSGSLAATTIWAAKGAMGSGISGFFSQTASPGVNRTIIQNWTLDPAVVPEKLEAIRCACQWVVYGPEAVCPDCAGLLKSPDQDPSPGRHFGVADRLAALPRGWLHVGALSDVPLQACYKAHHGTTWVWVTREGLQGLADFSLVIQSITRVYANSPTLFAIPPPTAPLKIITDAHKGGDKYAVTAVIMVNSSHQLVPASHYYPLRVDNVGADAHLASKINAAGVTP
jgi:hypothetical protein